MDLEYIRNQIKKCFDAFYLNDSDLLIRDNYEVTISCKFSQYLFSEFPKYDVDCEYNKHIDDDKELNGIGIVRPDIVIHKRGTDEKNLVYIEIKTDHNRKSREADYEKVKEATKQSGRYKYCLGVFIDLNRNKGKSVFKYFKDGKEWI